LLLSDYVIGFLVEKGVHDIFLVSGGGIMYLCDSVGRNPEMRYYCNYHEQACVASAEGYARLRNRIGAALVTAGPGASNAISGLLGSWIDSVPLIVISGNVKQELIADHSKMRQIGPQEADLLGMAKHVTKYAKSVRDPKTIRYELEYAYHQATSGRPGPVMLELPLDVQGAQVDPNELVGYTPESHSDSAALAAQTAEVIRQIKQAKRPIMVCGNGIHRAHAQDLLRSLLELLKIPIALPVTGKDIIEEDHPMNIGIFGTAGQRRANFAIQNSDCLIAIGAGLNCVKVGFDFKGFAPKARKIIVDIDEAQLKYQVVHPDYAVQADAGDFIREMNRQLKDEPYAAPSKWLNACADWRTRYPLMMPEYYADPEHVNSYVFYEKLAEIVKAEDVMVTGNALDTTSYFQAYRVRKGQRTINSGWGSMGWCLPMAIGACIANGKQRTLCVTGDGSFQFNVQELMTISRYRLPIKIFIFNNQGYSNIRGTQESFFEARYVGSDFDSGVSNPNFAKLADAYDFRYSTIRTNEDLVDGIRAALAMEGPSICEVNLSSEQRILPKASAFRRPDGTFESRPLQDMAPFLSREEVAANMHMFDGDDE
jgi:acetolactate synthase-1/2/3 large subunit